MKIAYFDCFSGLSGDMVLGALLDIGIDFDRLQAELAKLPLTKYAMTAKPVMRSPIGATKVSIKAVEKGLVRTYRNIRQIIDESGLNKEVQEQSLAVFQRLAEARAKVNRKNIETIHFHEVGAIDSIVDIVGTAIAFNLLGVERVYCSPLPMGIGMTRTEHGMMPIPAPVTLEILKGVPVYSTAIQAQLVSPTGAAIIRSYVNNFGNMPAILIDKIGYGGGRGELDTPNVLRLIVGESAEPVGARTTTLIATFIDKLGVKARHELIDNLMTDGALDVWTTPAGKANKEALELKILAPIHREEYLINAVFAHTKVDDVRISRQARRRRF